jgi:hypothetical protein
MDEELKKIKHKLFNYLIKLDDNEQHREITEKERFYFSLHQQLGDYFRLALNYDEVNNG